MPRVTPQASSPTSAPSSEPSEVIDVEFKEVSGPLPTPPRQAPVSVALAARAAPRPGPKRRAGATASVRQCPLCGQAAVLGDVPVMGPVTVKMCGRCAAISRGASMLLGHFLR